jgi:hypothetical protein
MQEAIKGRTSEFLSKLQSREGFITVTYAYGSQPRSCRMVRLEEVLVVNTATRSCTGTTRGIGEKFAAVLVEG